MKRPVKKKTSSQVETLDLRERLIEATLKLLKERPASEISLREVARLCQVSEAAPYRHFKDKDSLLAAVATRGFEYLRGFLEDALKTKGTYEQRFLKAGEAYLKMGLQYPEHLKLMFGSSISPSEDHPELMHTAKRSFLGLVKIVQTGQQEKVIGEGDPFYRAVHVWMMVHGFTMLLIDFRCAWLGLHPGNAVQAMNAYSRDILEGMRKPMTKSPGLIKLDVQGVTLEMLKEVGIDAKVVLA